MAWPSVTSLSVVSGVCAIAISITARVDVDATRALAQAPGRRSARPVRNDVPRPGRELLVLRNHQLRKGGHEPFYEFSLDGLWPYFERIGARIVGQWKVVDPASPSPNQEDVYRLVRYAGLEHWLATRPSNPDPIGGDGPAFEKGQQGLQDRRGLEVGSRGAYFLEGSMAPGGPYFMRALPERYTLVQEGQRPSLSEQDIPVRVDVAQPGREVVELRYQRIRKDSYDRFFEATRTRIWPWEEKLGARPIGQWRVVHPALTGARAPGGSQFMTAPSPDYDEVVTLTRYASRAHRDALLVPDIAVYSGGNGPDWLAWKTGLEEQRQLTTRTTIELVEGFLYQSPPVFLPGLPEQYRRVP